MWPVTELLSLITSRRGCLQKQKSRGLRLWSRCGAETERVHSIHLDMPITATIPLNWPMLSSVNAAWDEFLTKKRARSHKKKEQRCFYDAQILIVRSGLHVMPFTEVFLPKKTRTGSNPKLERCYSSALYFCFTCTNVLETFTAWAPDASRTDFLETAHLSQLFGVCDALQFL